MKNWYEITQKFSVCLFSLYLQILFDNQFHSGKLRITLDMDTYSFACKNWKISGTGKI